MVRCNLCNKNTRCSCKGGGCPGCNSTNKQVSFMNDLLKFGLPLESLRENYKSFREYSGKIDAYTAYEFFTGEIDQETFDTALEQYKPKYRKTESKKRNEVKDFVPTPNAKNHCVFDSNSPWARCKHCNSIRKYMQGKECPKYIGNEE